MFKLSVAFLSVSSVLAQVGTTGYCAALEAQCFGTYGINASLCEQVFNSITIGQITDEGNNTLGCRMKFMTRDPFNMTKDACRYAGPTGGGRCGPVLENLCEVANAACNGEPEAAYPDSDACKSGLGSLSNQWGYTQGPTSAGENSLECRAYQVMASKAVGQVALCANFNLSTPACNGRVVPNPSYYCETLQYNCNGTNLTQFAQEAQCNVIAAGYTTSSSDSAEGGNYANSLGCRAYHAQAALSSASIHCQHAGPSGGGVCGTYGQAWATMLKAAPCNDTSVYLLAAALNSTLDSVVPTGGGPYSVNLDNSGNTQACRIYHLGVASTDTTHCGHGSIGGNNSCGTIVGNLCDIIGNVCTWGTNATFQYTGRAACVLALNKTAMGTPGAMSGDNLACRYYHVGVAGSYRPGGAQSGAMDALTQQIAHCSHVIATPLAGCNGPSNAPTTAPPMMTSGAGTLSLAVSVMALAIASL